jgi:hypothetical protein
MGKGPMDKDNFQCSAPLTIEMKKPLERILKQQGPGRRHPE